MSKCLLTWTSEMFKLTPLFCISKLCLGTQNCMSSFLFPLTIKRFDTIAFLLRMHSSLVHTKLLRLNILSILMKWKKFNSIIIRTCRSYLKFHYIWLSNIYLLEIYRYGRCIILLRTITFRFAYVSVRQWNLEIDQWLKTQYLIWHNDVTTNLQNTSGTSCPLTWENFFSYTHIGNINIYLNNLKLLPCINFCVYCRRQNLI